MKSLQHIFFIIYLFVSHFNYCQVNTQFEIIDRYNYDTKLFNGITNEKEIHFECTFKWIDYAYYEVYGHFWHENNKSQKKPFVGYYDNIDIKLYTFEGIKHQDLEVKKVNTSDDYDDTNFIIIQEKDTITVLDSFLISERESFCYQNGLSTKITGKDFFENKTSLEFKNDLARRITLKKEDDEVVYLLEKNKYTTVYTLGCTLRLFLDPSFT